MTIQQRDAVARFLDCACTIVEGIASLIFACAAVAVAILLVVLATTGGAR